MNNPIKTIIRNFVCWALLMAGLVPAHALTIVRTNDPSVAANLSPADVASANAAFDYAAAQICAMFNDDVTLNITMAATPGTTDLGKSDSPVLGTFTYAQIRTALINSQTAHPTPDGATATAALPASDPYGGTGFGMARGLGKCLGLVGTPNDSSLDGTFTFGAGYAYTYDPANRGVTGKIDFIGVAFHEITELMGRINRLNSTGTGNRPFDVFRFTAPGVMSVNFTDANVYFSVNGGTTNLKTFNANGNGGDLNDWAGGTNDAFNAFSSDSVKIDMTAVDIQVMDVLGWSLAATQAAPVVTTNPLSPLANVGANVTFTAAATGTPVPVVQWQVNTGSGFANITGNASATTTTLSLSGVAFSQTGNQYRAVFTNFVNSTPTTAATLTVNRPPTVGNAVAQTRTTGSGFKIAFSRIFALGNVTDPDADPLTVTGGSATGGALAVSAGYLIYTPNAGNTFGDTITYTVSDGRGGTVNGTINVTVPVDNAPTNNIAKITKVVNSPAVVDFVGIPGFTYGVQYKLNLGDPNWVDIGPLPMDQFGAAHFTDNGPGSGPRTAAASGFYRFIYPVPAGP
ncbi:MAG: NF038122 family metalloprotease [Chthoniobacteraceae bacterium]